MNPRLEFVKYQKYQATCFIDCHQIYCTKPFDNWNCFCSQWPSQHNRLWDCSHLPDSPHKHDRTSLVCLIYRSFGGFSFTSCHSNYISTVMISMCPSYTWEQASIAHPKRMGDFNTSDLCNTLQCRML